MAAADSVFIWCGFRYLKLNCCFRHEPWQCPKLKRSIFSVRHFLSRLAWPLLVNLLQFPTDTCDCTRASLLVINVFNSS